MTVKNSSKSAHVVFDPVDLAVSEGDAESESEDESPLRAQVIAPYIQYHGHQVVADGITVAQVLDHLAAKLDISTATFKLCIEVCMSIFTEKNHKQLKKSLEAICSTKAFVPERKKDVRLKQLLTQKQIRELDVALSLAKEKDSMLLGIGRHKLQKLAGRITEQLRKTDEEAWIDPEYKSPFSDETLTLLLYRKHGSGFAKKITPADKAKWEAHLSPINIDDMPKAFWPLLLIEPAFYQAHWEDMELMLDTIEDCIDTSIFNLLGNFTDCILRHQTPSETFAFEKRHCSTVTEMYQSSQT